MTRRAVEKLLKEEPAWTTGWPWCGGQYQALYLKAGLAVYYGTDDTVIRTAPPWSELPAGGMIVGLADDW